MRQVIYIGIVKCTLASSVLYSTSCIATDIPCLEPVDTDIAKEMPEDILSVERVTDDDGDGYVLTIDMNLAELSLRSVTAVYKNNDEIMLATAVDMYPLSETQVQVSVLVNEAISQDVRLVFGYSETDARCPQLQLFEYKFGID